MSMPRYLILPIPFPGSGKQKSHLKTKRHPYHSMSFIFASLIYIYSFPFFRFDSLTIVSPTTRKNAVPAIPPAHAICTSARVGVP